MEETTLAIAAQHRRLAELWTEYVAPSNGHGREIIWRMIGENQNKLAFLKLNFENQLRAEQDGRFETNLPGPDQNS